MQPLSIVHTNDRDIAKQQAEPVSTYRQLVEKVAELSYLYKKQLIFFRGQGRDYRNKGGASTFYPTIYRGEYLPKEEAEYRFRVLDKCCQQLKNLFQSKRLDGKDEVARKKYVQWSILQHYEVCETPLLDFTHSLRVACSFAQLSVLNETEKSAYVYVFGLPYLSNRISINSEDDLVNVRLLSICPPQALRPYFQDGYLCGTTDLTWNYPDKTELDFNLRLIAKFVIPKYQKFWGEGFRRIPEAVLFPRHDKVEKLCSNILPLARDEILSEHLGDFVKEWSELETRITEEAQHFDPKVQSALKGVNVLRKNDVINKSIANEIDEIRRFRNTAVHAHEKVSNNEIINMKNKLINIKYSNFFQ